MNGAVIGIDHCLDAVSNVIEAGVAHADVSGVRITGRSGECVDHPVQVSVGTNDDVRVLVKHQERRQQFDALANIPAHQKHTVGRDVI